MAEKIKHQKTENEIKEDMIDLKVRHFKVDSANNNQSKYITKYFGDENNKLKGKIIPFFYNEYIDIDINLGDTDEKEIKTYFNTLKNDLRYAYDVPEILQKYEDYIETLDRPANEDLKKKLPRYKKMKRLESLYEILIKFTLTVLHNFFWNDITQGVDKGAGNKNITYRVKQVIPLMVKVKKIFEDEIDKEYFTSNDMDLNHIIKK